MTPVPAPSLLNSLTDFESDEEEEPELYVKAPAFFKELDLTVEHFILDCFQLDGNKGRDPRARHDFYQLIHNRLKLAVTRRFMKNTDSDFMPYWKKYDDWAASAVQEFLAVKDSNGKPRTFASEVPVIPANDQRCHAHFKQKIQDYIKTVFLKSRNEQNQFDLSSLEVRLTFFKSVSKCSAGIMNHYWHRLLYSTMDQLLLYMTVAKPDENQQVLKMQHVPFMRSPAVSSPPLPSLLQKTELVSVSQIPDHVMVEIELSY